MIAAMSRVGSNPPAPNVRASSSRIFRHHCFENRDVNLHAARGVLLPGGEGGEIVFRFLPEVLEIVLGQGGKGRIREELH